MSRLTIYFTSDTHGYLYNTTFADTMPRPVGLLGMDFPKDGNTLIIDGGDTIQGSPLTYFLHEKHILMVPGSGFDLSTPDHFRIVMLPEPEEMAQAMDLFVLCVKLVSVKKLLESKN